MKMKKTQAKRIAFMSTLPPPSTGEANVTLTYFESLPDLGYEVCLIDTGIRDKQKMPGALSVYNVLRFIRHFWLLAKCCLFSRPDMINFMFSSRSVLKFAIFIIFTRLLGIKAIGQMHDPSIDRIYDDASPSRRKYLQFVLTLPSEWVVLGQRWHAFMLRVGVDPEKICIIPNTVKSVFAQVALDNKKPKETDPPCILFVGRIGLRKGMDLLLDALVALQKEGVEFITKIVGDTYLAGDMEKYTADFKAHLKPGSYEFIPHQENDQLIKLFLQASVFVLPSRSENLPVVMLEAMSCGNAVVATDVGSVSDVLHNNENGILIAPENSDLLFASISKLLNDANLRKTLGKNAQKTIVDNHLPRTAGEKMHAFVRHLEDHS